MNDFHEKAMETDQDVVQNKRGKMIAFPPKPHLEKPDGILKTKQRENSRNRQQMMNNRITEYKLPASTEHSGIKVYDGT